MQGAGSSAASRALVKDGSDGALVSHTDVTDEMRHAMTPPQRDSLETCLDNMTRGSPTSTAISTSFPSTGAFLEILGFPAGPTSRPAIRSRNSCASTPSAANTVPATWNNRLPNGSRWRARPSRIGWSVNGPTAPWWKSSARPLPEGGFVTTYTDITDRKKQDQRVEDNAALLQRITANLPGAVFRLVQHTRRAVRPGLLQRGHSQAAGSDAGGGDAGSGRAVQCDPGRGPPGLAGRRPTVGRNHGPLRDRVPRPQHDRRGEMAAQQRTPPSHRPPATSSGTASAWTFPDRKRGRKRRSAPANSGSATSPMWRRTGSGRPTKSCVSSTCPTAGPKITGLDPGLHSRQDAARTGLGRPGRREMATAFRRPRRTAPVPRFPVHLPHRRRTPHALVDQRHADHRRTGALQGAIAAPARTSRRSSNRPWPNTARANRRNWPTVEVGIPGHDEPRTAHAAERHHRFLRTGGRRAYSAAVAPGYRDYAQGIHESGQHLLELINDDPGSVQGGGRQVRLPPRINAR